jgi:hypothetical protein
VASQTRNRSAELDAFVRSFIVTSKDVEDARDQMYVPVSCFCVDIFRLAVQEAEIAYEKSRYGRLPEINIYFSSSSPALHSPLLDSLPAAAVAEPVPDAARAFTDSSLAFHPSSLIDEALIIVRWPAMLSRFLPFFFSYRTSGLAARESRRLTLYSM